MAKAKTLVVDFAREKKAGYQRVFARSPQLTAMIEVPKRASYIRVIMLELTRLVNHLLWLGLFVTIGTQALFFPTVRDREYILDLFEAVTGYRMINHNYFRVGGVVNHYECYDMPEASKIELLSP